MADKSTILADLEHRISVLEADMDEDLDERIDLYLQDIIEEQYIVNKNLQKQVNDLKASLRLIHNFFLKPTA